MLKKSRKIILPFGLLLSIFLLVEGNIQTKRGGDFLGSLTILSEEGFDSSLVGTASEGQQVLEASGQDGEEEGIFTFAAWTEFRNEFVSDGFSRKQCNVDVTAVCGPSHCLLPFGKELSAQDREGCIIGRKMAEKLFGSSMAEGQEILWRDRRWFVRGVVGEPADLLMVQASGIKDEITFHKISIAPNGTGDRKLTGEKFLSRYGILAQPLRFDYLYGVGWIKEMVPDKWSDFSGWEQNLEEYGRAVKYVQNAEKSTIEAAGLRHKKTGRRYLFCGVLCLFVLLCGRYFLGYFFRTDCEI